MSKSQVSVIDLFLLLVVAVTLLTWVFLIRPAYSLEFVNERFSGEFNKRLFYSMLDYEINNLTVMNWLGLESCSPGIINFNITGLINKLNKPNYDFILFLNGSNTLIYYSNQSFVCLEKLNPLQIKLINKCGNATLYFANWPDHLPVSEC